jgi:hypothetical protein
MRSVRKNKRYQEMLNAKENIEEGSIKMKLQGFIKSYISIIKEEVRKGDCPEVKKALFVKTLSCFYRNLSKKEQRKYHGTLQFIIKTYLNDKVKLEKVSQFESEEEMKMYKQNNRETLIEAIDHLSKNPNDPYTFITHGQITGRVGEGCVSKENLLEKIKEWEETYGDEFTYSIPLPLLDKIQKYKKQKEEVEA